MQRAFEAVKYAACKWMFFRKVIYLVCYSRIFSPFLFLLPCCSWLALCSLASHSAAVRSFSLVFSLLLFSFVSALASFLAFALFFCPFSSFSCPFSFRKHLITSAFARTPLEPSPTTSQPSHCCRDVTTS